MTAPVQSERERIARELQIAIVGKGACWGMTHPDRANELLAAADWIIARQQEREGPLVEALESIGYWPKDKSLRFGVDAHDAREALAAYRAIDAPPQRTVEDVLREWNDRAGPLEARAALAVRLLDELAALKRGKE